MKAIEKSKERLIIGQILSLEDTITEYKGHKGGNAVNTIVDTTYEYVVGFLNSKGGSISWGVSNNRIIEGVALNESAIDEIQNKLSQKLRNIHPAPSISIPPIEVYEIYESITSDCPLANLYVIRLVVPAGDPRELYSKNEKGDVYIRDNTTTRKIGKDEIYNEIKRRRQEAYLIPFYPGRREKVVEIISKLRMSNSILMPLFPAVPLRFIRHPHG